MTASLLLAITRRRVLPIEKAPRMGGSLGRFCRDSIPFADKFNTLGIEVLCGRYIAECS